MEFEDDLSNDIAAAIDKADAAASAPPASDKPGDALPPSAAVVPSAAPVEGERARDDAGRFAAKPAETPVAVAPVAVAPVAAAAAASVEVPAPAHWKGGGKVAWGTLPAEVRQHISDDYAQVTTTQAELTRLKTAIGPERAQVLAANYGSVEQGLQNILAGSDFANKNPQGFILWLAQRAGVDLTQLAGQGPGDGSAAPEATNPLVQEVTQLRRDLQELRQSQTQAPIQSQINAMAGDAANYPYFNDVRPTMAAIIQTGAAKTLAEAYEQAVWARPDIRTSLIEMERKKSADAESAKVAKAQQAAVSITGSPRGAKALDEHLDEDLEATVRRNVDRVLAA